MIQGKLHRNFLRCPIDNDRRNSGNRLDGCKMRTPNLISFEIPSRNGVLHIVTPRQNLFGLV